MGDISKLGWLIGSVKQAMWADSLYILYVLLVSIWKILTYFQPILIILSQFICLQKTHFQTVP